MNDIFTILLFSAFSLAGSELPLHYGHVPPLFLVYFAYFIGSSSILTIRVHSNIHCDF
jgi:hypothetical protein